MRHMFHVPTNDMHATMCGAAPSRDNLVRMDSGNVDCVACQSALLDLRNGRHDADGKAYIAYFNPGVMVGFIWDGDPSSPVQVTREMGEPIIAMFPLSIDLVLTLPEQLATFRTACDKWLHDNADLF